MSNTDSKEKAASKTDCDTHSTNGDGQKPMPFSIATTKDTTGGGLYTIFDRVSCWCCPLQSLEDFRKLYKHFPDLWAELLDMDRRTWRNILKDGMSVEKLQKRFDFEEEWQSQGKSIKSREFFKELKIRLEETNNE